MNATAIFRWRANLSDASLLTGWHALSAVFTLLAAHRIAALLRRRHATSKLHRLPPHARHLHALEGLLRRLFLTPYREAWVLRGSLLLRGYCPQTPRHPDDLDFLVLHANDERASLEAMREVCAAPGVDDGVEFDAEQITAARTWEETEAPGLKLTIRWRLKGEQAWSSFNVDLGWGDPLRPPPRQVLLPSTVGPAVAVYRAAALETLFGWKLHGLFEREPIGLSEKGVPKGYWRPKDLFDLYVVARSGQLSMADLPPAVEIAFSSRGYPLSRLVRLAERRFGTGPTSRRNWARWRASLLDQLAARAAPAPHLDVPADAAAAVAAVAPLAVAALEALGYERVGGDESAASLAPAWQVDAVRQLVADARRRLVPRAAPPPPAAAAAVAPHRAVSATAPTTEAYFVLGGANPIKWEESRKVLSEWADIILPSDYTPPRHLRFPAGLADGSVTPADAARQLATHCFAELRRPCIVDLLYLELYDCGTFHLLPPAGETAFARDHAGRPGSMHALVCYTADGVRTQLFTGELEGRVVHPVRGDKAYGFNRAWLPDGYQLTLGEMRSSFFAVHPRLKPLLELASCLRSESAYGTLEAGNGLFEVHITVRTPAAEEGGVASFEEACALCGVKAVLIENDGGETPTQVMTASYVKGTLPHVHHEAFRLSQRLLGMGFHILRVKVESTFSNPGVPRDDAEAAALSPHNYFEFHWKLRLPPEYDHAALTALVRPHGARLSRSALRKVASGHQHRFVTLRLYDVGREGALHRMQALTSALADAGHDVLTTIREYAVYDSNVGLDAGWIDSTHAGSHPSATPPPQPPSYIAPPQPPPAPACAAPPPACAEETSVAALATRVRRLLWQPVHPLRTADLRALVAQLRLEVQQGRVSAHASGPADAPCVIYHYRQNVKAWSDALLLARGAVLCQPEGGAPHALATPFPKFFELHADGIGLRELFERSVRWEATEKLDGSMGLLFHHRGAWTLITKRAWHSAQAEWGREWLRAQGVRLEELRVGATYVCEIVYAANLVVVQYDKSREGVVLCGAVGEDGVELDREHLEQVAARSGLPLVPLHSSGVGGAALEGAGEEPQAAAFDGLRDVVSQVAAYRGREKEGLVLRFSFKEGGSHRVKLKSDDYKRIYRLQDGCTEKGVWAAVRSGARTVEEMRAALPPQFLRFFDQALAEVLENVKSVLCAAHHAVEMSGCADGRQLAAYMKEHQQWADGSEITQLHRKLAHKALVGRLGRLHQECRAAEPVQIMAALECLDSPTRQAVFTHVPVPSVAPDGCVTSADGVLLLNHRR